MPQARLSTPVAGAVAPVEPRPLVSVVVPAYNAAWSIERTLASVCAQTFPDFEVVVVDDGSTDATAEIVADLARGDPRVRLLRKSNGGVASARNLGLRAARGVYIAPLDSDDLWMPEFLERQIAALQAAGPDVVMSFAHTLCIDHEGRPLKGEPPEQPKTDFRNLLLRNAVANGSSAVFRRDRLLETGGYDEGLHAADAQGAEDWKLVLLLAARGRVVHVPERLVLYRISRSSMSHNLTVMRRSVLKVIDDMRRQGPRLAPWTYWHARTLILVWILPRALTARNWREAAHMAVRAYLLNPFWWVNPEPRHLIKRMFVEGIRKALGLRRPRAAAQAEL